MGGVFAPPLDYDRLELYRELAEKASPEVREEMLDLCDTVGDFLDSEDAPVAKASANGNHNHPKHQSGVGYIIPLSEKTRKVSTVQGLRKHRLNSLGNPETHKGLFDLLPTGTKETTPKDSESFSDGETRLKASSVVSDSEARDIRDAAFHLLWFARELEMGRVPMTQDMLPDHLRPAARTLSTDSPVTIRPLAKTAKAESKKKSHK